MVSNLVSVNPDHVRLLCSTFDLGVPSGEVTSVYGGFNHKMWRLDTDRHRYALKQLSSYTDLHDAGTIQHFNVSESIAAALGRHGIPTVAALYDGSTYLQSIDDIGYLVYPWSHGIALPRTQIEKKHALRIAGLLADMHQADITVPGVRKTRFDPHPSKRIEPLLRRAGDCHELEDKHLYRHLQRFVAINEACPDSARILRQRMVIGHGDMDQKNVLWGSDGNPQIIDWESARLLNPSYELVNMGLDWSGISSVFDAGLFVKTLAAYQQAGGHVDRDFLQPAIDCILADWLTWFLYIVAVYLDKDESRRRANDLAQIDFVLATILRLQRLAPDLVTLAQGVADR